MAQTANEMSDELAERVKQRVAQLHALMVPVSQIAATVGLDEVAVQALIDQPQVAQVVTEKRMEMVQSAIDRNTGWDAIESEAEAVVLEHVVTARDPEFALRAARAANAAIRRGPQSHTLSGQIEGAVGAHAVINLSAILVEKLQFLRIGPRELNAEAHRVDALPLAEAERVLRPAGLADQIRAAFEGVIEIE